jgi:hypothetical protein
VWESGEQKEEDVSGEGSFAQNMLAYRYVGGILFAFHLDTFSMHSTLLLAGIGEICVRPPFSTVIQDLRYRGGVEIHCVEMYRSYKYVDFT